MIKKPVTKIWSIHYLLKVFVRNSNNFFKMSSNYQNLQSITSKSCFKTVAYKELSKLPKQKTKWITVCNTIYLYTQCTREDWAYLNSKPFSRVPRFRLWYWSLERNTSTVSPCLSTCSGTLISSLPSDDNGWVRAHDSRKRPYIDEAFTAVMSGSK